MRMRRAGVEDLPSLMDLERRNAELGFVGQDAESVHGARIASGDAAYFLFEHDDVPAGFVILCGLASPHRCIELKRIVVEPPGRGFGKLALRLVLAEAFVQLGAHRVWLDVYADNTRARRAYRALGFMEEGVMRECIRQGDRFRSLVFMAMLEGEYRQRHG
jgi:RimJ/RimL family protein N-acetyltransferase